MIDEALIKRIAHASHLTLTDKEIEKFKSDLDSITDAFKIIDECDVTGVKSSFRPIEERNILREDIEGKTISQENALKFTKDKENGFFIGPRTVE
jgi:aspartyl-tRNA(Asn)/glutamyl-tRNA(Gln) amidotransferase subunit C